LKAWKQVQTEASNAPGTRRSLGASPTSIPAGQKRSHGKKFGSEFPPDSLMTHEVSFHEEASAEYEAAFEWYFLRSEFVASRFAEELNQAIATISEAPKRWPMMNNGIRKFLLQRFPFAVIYREIPSGVQVLAIAHGHRNPGYWKKRI
jgi:plasmid stabilization system protein ParE